MILLVMVVESWLNRHDRMYRAIIPSCYRFARQMAEREGPQNDVLGFGDSLMKFGFVPKVIRKGTGRKTYNLAIVGGQPPASYAALRQALDAGAKPSAIVFDCKANILSTDFQVNRDNVSDLFELRDALDVAWTSHDASFFASVAIDRTLNSARRRVEVRSAVLRAFRGEKESPWTKVGPYLRNAIVNQGAFINPKSRFDGRITPNLKHVYLPKTWTPDRLNSIYVRRFLTLAESRGIPVYWVVPPISPKVQELREQAGLDKQFLQFVWKMQRHHANLIVIDGRHSGYPHTLFDDPVHLSGDGAASFSAGVAEVLHHDLGEPAEQVRWIPLPPYRPVAIALENLDQSKQVVGRASDRRRR
ncbi:MAG: DUF1574 family protein [Isosphaeraceae bacterium]